MVEKLLDGFTVKYRTKEAQSQKHSNAYFSRHLFRSLPEVIDKANRRVPLHWIVNAVKMCKSLKKLFKWQFRWYNFKMLVLPFSLKSEETLTENLAVSLRRNYCFL